MTKDKRLGVRFIEFMPFGDNDWKETDWVGWEEVWDRLVAAGIMLRARLMLAYNGRRR